MSRILTQALTVALVGTLVIAVRAQSPPDAERPSQPLTAPVKPAAPDAAPLVQLAILLDNSGSMSGLIEQAKSELWRVVNELTTARQNASSLDCRWRCTPTAIRRRGGSIR